MLKTSQILQQGSHSKTYAVVRSPTLRILLTVLADLTVGRASSPGPPVSADKSAEIRAHEKDS